jgi:hypothetical protein
LRFSGRSIVIVATSPSKAVRTPAADMPEL